MGADGVIVFFVVGGTAGSGRWGGGSQGTAPDWSGWRNRVDLGKQTFRSLQGKMGGGRTWVQNGLDRGIQNAEI